MAHRTTISNFPLPVLKSAEQVTKKIKDNKLVLLVFNIKDLDDEDLERSFSSWREDYEDKYDLHVYKCIVAHHSTPLEIEYNITKPPTFIFFNDGKLMSRLEDVEDDANGSSSLKIANDKLKSWLEQCCTSN